MLAEIFMVRLEGAARVAKAAHQATHGSCRSSIQSPFKDEGRPPNRTGRLQMSKLRRAYCTPLLFLILLIGALTDRIQAFGGQSAATTFKGRLPCRFQARTR
jgi:hypothetical protein